MADPSLAHATGRDRMLGHLAMIGFAIINAGSFTFGKMATPYIEPVPLNAIRFIIASLVMAALTFGWRGLKPALPPASWRFAILGLLLAIYFVTMFMGLELATPVSNSAVFTLTPIMAAIFGFVLLGQRVSPLVAVSLIAAGIGAVWVIFSGDIDAILAFRLGPGESIYFIGCAFHALYAPLLKKFSRGEPVMLTTFLVLSFVAIWVIVYGIGDILATDWPSMPPIVWGVILYLALFAGIVSFFLLQIGSLRLPAAKVLAYGYLVPVFVIGLEGLLGHGWAAPTILAGAAVTLLGLVVLYFSKDG